MSIVHRVLFMRHPETFANTDGFFSGGTNVDLTDKGNEQLQNAVAAVEAFAPERIYSSPLLRCQAIANTAAEGLGCPVEILDDLIEINFGVMELKPFKELYPTYGIHFPWPRDEDGNSMPCEGAESFEHAYERAGRILGLVREGQGRTACISHGGLIRCIIGRLLEMKYERIWNLRFVNVASCLLTCEDSGKIMLEGMGYTPEEIAFRSTHESLYDTFSAFEK